MYYIYIFYSNLTYIDIWMSPSLNKLTPIVFNMDLTHLGLEASIWKILFMCLK